MAIDHWHCLEATCHAFVLRVLGKNAIDCVFQDGRSVCDVGGSGIRGDGRLLIHRGLSGGGRTKTFVIKLMTSY